MRIDFLRADFDALADCWSRFFPPRYRVDAAMIRRNTVESPVFDWGASFIETGPEGVLGFVAVKKSANPSLYGGPDPDQAHISAIAFTDPQLGVDLLAQSKRVLRDRGVYKLVFGQDSRHFFPGCPEDFPLLRSFLQVEGFQERGTEVDLERDLADYQPKPGTLEALERECAEVRPVQPDEAEALHAFLSREFPGRWTHDVMHKIEQEGRADFVYALWVNGQVNGFAHTQDWTHRLPVCGAVWHLDLGPNWGALGPIGVSKALRGRGLGDALLSASLAGLRDRGARRTIIDWTTLVGYYGRHGFEVARRYHTLGLLLDPA